MMNPMLGMFLFLTIYSSAMATHTQDRRVNCDQAQAFCMTQCERLSSTATCFGSCGLFFTKTWRCEQLVSRTGGCRGQSRTLSQAEVLSLVTINPSILSMG